MSEQVSNQAYMSELTPAAVGLSHEVDKNQASCTGGCC